MTTAGIWPPAKTCCGCVIRIFLSTTTIAPQQAEPGDPFPRAVPATTESFHNSIDAVAGDAVGRELIRLGVTADRLTPDERMQIIASLESGGIFLLKGAVKDVADALHCSQASVYRYLPRLKGRHQFRFGITFSMSMTKTAESERNARILPFHFLSAKLLTGGIHYVSRVHPPVVLADPGVVVSSIGIAMMLQANVGFEPWSVLQQGMSLRTGMTYGTASAIAGAAAILTAVFFGESFGFGTIINIAGCAVIIGDPGGAPHPADARIGERHCHAHRRSGCSRSAPGCT
ncbi:MAG: helix-turn-helix domain-containing protein [Butyricicoccus sp.]